MRKMIVAGNWKMNTSLEEGVGLANEVVKLIKEKGAGRSEVILAPPFTHLSSVVHAASSSVVKVAAQNCAATDKGAYTGEISAGMVRSAGASHVIIGHSERRTLFKEDDILLKKKVQQVLLEGLTPIFCCGEMLEEREYNRHFQVVASQLENAVFGLDAEDFEKIVIAYEPVWAIGTGRTASPEQAQEMHAYIRKLIAGRFGESTSKSASILYGGSCKASNAAEIFAQPDVDGGLIGGASLNASEFVQIVHSF